MVFLVRGLSQYFRKIPERVTIAPGEIRRLQLYFA